MVGIPQLALPAGLLSILHQMAAASAPLHVVTSLLTTALVAVDISTTPQVAAFLLAMPQVVVFLLATLKVVVALPAILQMVAALLVALPVALLVVADLLAAPLEALLLEADLLEMVVPLEGPLVVLLLVEPHLDPHQHLPLAESNATSYCKAVRWMCDSLLVLTVNRVCLSVQAGWPALGDSHRTEH